MTTIDIQAEIAAGRELIAKLPAVKDFALIGSASYRPDPHDVDFAILIDPAHNAVDYCTTLINDGWGNCGDYDGVGEPFAACYWDTAEGRVFGLRANDDGLDVSDIAKQYGGGGHAKAAGFKVPRDHALAQA